LELAKAPPTAQSLRESSESNRVRVLAMEYRIARACVYNILILAQDNSHEHHSKDMREWEWGRKKESFDEQWHAWQTY
jgi:hypothetical protein